MFPFEDEADAIIWDEYGAAINEEDFKFSEEVLGESTTSPLPLYLGV